MQLTEAVPWGRLASEYINMFALTPQDMKGRILDCAGGPSSFTSELTSQGKKVVSCDPLYQFTQEEITERIDALYPKMTALNEANRDNFLWEMYGSPTLLGQIRMRAMRLFLDDYLEGKEHGRYITGELPCLPFESDSFDLALCSHLLFTYSEQFTTKFHVESVVEMARVATEVRVFPLLTAFTGEVSPHLPAVMEALRDQGCSVDIRPVAYEFQKGGNKMLVVARQD
ncbi:MAG: hypothetical protein JWL77_4558 [Chthonomonadaceae bacterium]|nr:hypothetical protein [Chthonomonadaceae bacterium]